MYPNVPPLEQLITLIAVDEHRSIASAARALGFSQQTVSARVTSAEKSLGVTVFRRGTAGSEPTEQGRSILDAAHEFVAAAGTFSRIVAGATRPDAARSLRVAVSNTVAELYFPSWASRFHRRNPQVRLLLQPCNSAAVEEAVIDGESPLGFVEGTAVSRGLDSVVVGVDDLIVVVPPSHPWAQQGAQQKTQHGMAPAEAIAGIETSVPSVGAALLRQTSLIMREPGSGSREVVEEVLGGIAPPAGEFGSLAAQRAAVVEMGEPTVIAARAVAAQLASGELVRIAVRDLTFRRLIRAVFPRGGNLESDAASLLSIAREGVGGGVSASGTPL